MQDDNTIETMTPPDGPCEWCGEPGWLGEDPYEADVNQNPGAMVTLCAACERRLAESI